MKLSLSTKIFFAFSLVVASFGVGSIFGIARLNAVSTQINTINQGYLPMNRVVAEIETLEEITRQGIDNILHFHDIDLQRSLLSNNRLSFNRKITVKLEQARIIIRGIEETRAFERNARFLQSIDKHLDRIEKSATDFGDALELCIESFETGTIQPVRWRKAGQQLVRDVQLAKLVLKNIITSQMLAVEKDESSAIGVILWLMIFAVLVSTALTVVSLLAVRPIKQLTQAARNISKGNFLHTVDITTKDEFGLLAGEFNNMARSLAQREAQFVLQQSQLEKVNHKLRQSSIDLELMRLYNEHIICSMHNGILVANASGVITTVNPAAQKLWMLDAKKTIGKRLDELPIAPFLQKLTNNWTQVMSKKKDLFFEAMEFSLPYRTQLLVDVYVSPLQGTDGHTHGVLVVGEDVTEKVHTKQALLQSERLATIGRMSALVAHEIRNPLSSIGLNVELLQDELDNPREDFNSEAHSVFKSILREVERLTEVTDEYLKFTRVPKPTFVPERLNQIINDLLGFMAEELENAKIELHYCLDSQVNYILCDEHQLRQAFLNLIKNSAESMTHGGVLTISTYRQDSTVQVHFRDTGTGIKQSDIGKIFDPFFSTREGGTGLGLSVTQQIVNEHKGTIECKSISGKGTWFIVQLPIYEADTLAITQQRE